MISRFSQRFASKARYFSEGTKKAQMEVTVRTPYQSFLANFEDFSRIVTRTNEATLVIQNQTPPATYVLPPGFLKVRLNGEVDGTSGDYIHTGGWAVVHPDNTCTIDLFDAFERDQVSAETLLDHELEPVTDDIQGKFVEKIRRNSQTQIGNAL